MTRRAGGVPVLALGGLLALAACGPRVAVTPEPLGTARIAETRIEGAQHTTLALTSWAPSGSPRAVILALHGYGDTAQSTYAWAAEAWARRGILTYAYDQRGFGANPDRRTWPGAEVLAADAVAVSLALRDRHPGLPLVVVGHSMGGGVTLAAAAEGLAADGIVLVAPAIAGGDQLSPITRAGAWAIGTLAADRRFTGSALDLSPTDNPDAIRVALADPWHFSDPAGRDLWGLVRISDRAARAAEDVALPALTLMGQNDDYVRPAAVEAGQARLDGPSRYIRYENGYHWLMRDRQAARVWEDIATFVLARDGR